MAAWNDVDQTGRREADVRLSVLIARTNGVEIK
jgi:hypothetical protein